MNAQRKQLETLKFVSVLLRTKPGISNLDTLRVEPFRYLTFMKQNIVAVICKRK